jgi:tetratricopeptide (TPR) repeat protein
MSTGDFVDKAEKLLLDAANQQPSHSTIAAYACAFMIEEKAEYAVAQDYLENILALDPLEPDLYHSYALLQLYGGARAAMDLEATEGARSAQELCRTCQSEAVKAWKMALSLHPAHNPSVSAYASRLVQHEQFSAAESVFKNALKVHPNSAVLTFKLAQMKHMLLDRLQARGGAGAGGRGGGGGGGGTVSAGAGGGQNSGAEGTVSLDASLWGESDAIAVAQLYDTTLMLNPSHTNAMLAKAHLLHNSVGASARDVEVLYQQVLRRDPLNVDALCNYGLLLHETPPADNNLTYADYFELDENLRQARQLSECDMQAALLPATLDLLPEGRVDGGDAAMPAWAAAAAEGGGGWATMRQAAAASALFEGALRVNQHHVATLCNYAAFLASQYQHDLQSVRRARQLLTQGLRLDPHHLDCLSSLGALVAFFPECLGEGGGGVLSGGTIAASEGVQTSDDLEEEAGGREAGRTPRPAAPVRRENDIDFVGAKVKEEEGGGMSGFKAKAVNEVEEEKALLQRLLIQITGNSSSGDAYNVQREGEIEDGAEDQFSALRAADKAERLQAQAVRFELAQRIFMRVLDLSPGYAAASTSYSLLLDTLKVENPLEYEAMLVRDLQRPQVLSHVWNITRNLNDYLLEHNDAMHFTYLRPLHFYDLEERLAAAGIVAPVSRDPAGDGEEANAKRGVHGGDLSGTGLHLLISKVAGEEDASDEDSESIDPEDLRDAFNDYLKWNVTLGVPIKLEVLARLLEDKARTTACLVSWCGREWPFNPYSSPLYDEPEIGTSRPQGKESRFMDSMASSASSRMSPKAADGLLHRWSGLNDGYVQQVLNLVSPDTWSSGGGGSTGGRRLEGGGGDVHAVRRIRDSYVCILSSLATRLGDEDHPASDILLRRALELDPAHVPSLSNYASLLDQSQNHVLLVAGNLSTRTFAKHMPNAAAHWMSQGEVGKALGLMQALPLNMSHEPPSPVPSRDRHATLSHSATAPAHANALPRSQQHQTDTRRESHSSDAGTANTIKEIQWILGGCGDGHRGVAGDGRVAGGVEVAGMWRVREYLYQNDLLTDKGYKALGLHIDAAILAPSNSGILANLCGSIQDALARSYAGRGGGGGEGGGDSPVEEGDTEENKEAGGVLAANWNAAADMSRRLAEAAVQLQPTNVAALLNLATFHTVHKPCRTLAQVLLSRALDVTPAYAPASVSYAALLHEHYVDLGLVHFLYHHGLALSQNDVLALNNAALLHKFSPQEYDSAELMHHRALSTQPYHLPSLCNLAALHYTAKRDFKEAESIYKRALAQFPACAPALLGLGCLQYEGLESTDVAESYWEEALRVDPTYSNALCNWGNMKAEINNDNVGAEALFKKSLIHDPGHVPALYCYSISIFVGLFCIYVRSLLTRMHLSGHVPTLYCYSQLLSQLSQQTGSTTQSQMAEEMLMRAVEAAPSFASGISIIVGLFCPFIRSFLTRMHPSDDLVDDAVSKGLRDHPWHGSGNTCECHRCTGVAVAAGGGLRGKVPRRARDDHIEAFRAKVAVGGVS